MNAPSIAYSQLAPMLIVFGAAVAGVLIEAFLPRKARYRAQLTLSLAALFVALIWVLRITLQLRGGVGNSVVAGAVDIDGPTLFLQATILLIGVLSVLLIAERRAPAETPDGAVALDAFTADASTVPGSVAEKVATKAALIQTEVFPLTMFAIGGMMLFPAAGDFLTMFIALEVLSLPLYLMCGLARRRRLLSQEAALKYFLLGAFSSAFFLYGIALLYGYAGTLSLTGIAEAIHTKPGNTTLALLGTALVSVGLLFKVGAVPFHSWVPDVYQGAPTPITAFMAAATKVAAFGAMLRVFYVALPALQQDWRPVLWVVAILTMMVGAILAIAQTDVKRLLAYSAVAQSGFLLIGVIAGGGEGLSATLFNLATYALTTVAAFAVVGLVRDSGGEEDTVISQWAGLGRRHPVTALIFALLLLALAGIPLTSGFIGKFAIFAAAAHSGQFLLVVVGVIASAITVYAYARVVVMMFFTDPPADPVHVRGPGRLTGAAIVVGAAVTLVFGVMPQPLLDLAHRAGMFLM